MQVDKASWFLSIDQFCIWKGTEQLETPHPGIQLTTDQRYLKSKFYPYRLFSYHDSLNNTVEQVFSQHLHCIRYYKIARNDLWSLGRGIYNLHKHNILCIGAEHLRIWGAFGVYVLQVRREGIMCVVCHHLGLLKKFFILFSVKK